jgi:peptidoglycan/xylan/chitin deacetylase (PgdA/CDA1 family)
LADQILAVEIPCEEEDPLRAVCLLYHDVVDSDDWDSTGFTGPGTARYKLSRADFAAHLRAIADVRHDKANRAHDLLNGELGSFPFLLTFDDGGESASTQIAGLLQEHGWYGHFFITAGKIGARGFLTSAQIRELRSRGHIIGSHSLSHPVRMSHCNREELLHEWTTSLHILSDLLGESVDTASVPGGYYSQEVGETAAEAGVRILFNSEPITQTQRVSGCILAGRFNIFRGAPPSLSGQLVSQNSNARLQQWLFWNSKKIVKTIAGRPYLAARDLLLRRG